MFGVTESSSRRYTSLTLAKSSDISFDGVGKCGSGHDNVVGFSIEADMCWRFGR